VGVLAHVAEEVRRRRVAELRRRAAAVGPASAAPLGLCFLPAFFLVGIVPTVIGLAGTLRW
jgi:pilus assembly protein TadC